MRFIDTSYSEFYFLKLWLSFLGSKLASLTDAAGGGSESLQFGAGGVREERVC